MRYHIIKNWCIRYGINIQNNFAPSRKYRINLHAAIIFLMNIAIYDHIRPVREPNAKRTKSYAWQILRKIVRITKLYENRTDEKL